MVALEAMACGTPMIASRVGGIPFTVRDGENGYLVTEGEPDELADKVRTVLTDDEIKSTLAHRGMTTARGHGWRTIADRLLSVYNELIKVDLHRGGDEKELNH
jgi:glycosyltransferase involved in cell wall biosynthesis